MKTIILISIILFFNGGFALFQSCMEVSIFEKNKTKYLETTFYVTGYLRGDLNQLPDKCTLLGKGSFGVVFETYLLVSKHLPISSAVKAIKYDKTLHDKFVGDFMFLTEIGVKYPLLFPRYYNCVYDYIGEGLLIFTEKLDSNLEMKTEQMANKLGQKRYKHLFLAYHTDNLANQLGKLALIAYGVGIIHFNNLIHYDIKPGNIIELESDPRILKLIDYGLIHEADQEFNTELRGTKDYCDPSMNQDNSRVTTASDVYSLGITFIELFFDIFIDFEIDDNDLDSLYRESKIRYEKYVTSFQFIVISELGGYSLKDKMELNKIK